MRSGALTVAFVNSTRKWGGVKTWTLDFGQALAERGHGIVAVVRDGTPFVEACRRGGLRTHAFRFGPKYNPLAILRLVNLLRRERPHAVVVNISRDLEVGAVAARLCGLPVIHRVGLLEDFTGSWEDRLHHRLLVDRVVVPSQYLRERLRESLPWLATQRISVVPNSKRLERYGRITRSAAEPPVVGITSQLNPSKGHTYLFRAHRVLKDRAVSFRLRVAGTGPHEEVLREEVAALGLQGDVEFCGFQEDIPGFLSGLDAYVLPSLNESFSNAVLEAMCTGLPVVAFAAGGVPEVVGDAGILTPPRDVASLAESLGRVLGDPDLRRNLGRAARQRAEEHFDLAKNVRLLEGLLGEVARR